MQSCEADAVSKWAAEHTTKATASASVSRTDLVVQLRVDCGNLQRENFRRAKLRRTGFLQELCAFVEASATALRVPKRRWQRVRECGRFESRPLREWPGILPAEGAR